MNRFVLYGRSIDAEFLGNFANADSKINVVYVERGDYFRAAKPDLLCNIGWTVQSTGGVRGLYIRYASDSERPCELLLNGKLVQKYAAFEGTHSAKAIDWRYQATVELSCGGNKLELQSMGGTPNIYEIAVGSTPHAEIPSVDGYYDMLHAERSPDVSRRSLVVSPNRFAGLVDAARGALRDHDTMTKLQSIAGLVVAAVGADSANGQAHIPWGGPLNGQRVRQYVFDRLMRIGIDAIIETGTYLGTSTAFFARQGVPVFTCESQERYFASAIAHLSGYSNIEMHLEDSRRFLARMATEDRNSFEYPFFYLDAHWYDDVPLSEEIRIIRSRWKNFVIMVDDFEVPGTDYGYDRYPNGLELSLEYLKREAVDLQGAAIMFPTAMASAETGMRRGTLVLTSECIYLEKLRGERALYRHEMD